LRIELEHRREQLWHVRSVAWMMVGAPRHLNTAMVWPIPLRAPYEFTSKSNSGRIAAAICKIPCDLWAV
jgi:hypothetical protein